MDFNIVVSTAHEKPSKCRNFSQMIASVRPLLYSSFHVPSDMLIVVLVILYLHLSPVLGLCVEVNFQASNRARTNRARKASRAGQVPRVGAKHPNIFSMGVSL